MQNKKLLTKGLLITKGRDKNIISIILWDLI